MRIQSLLRLLLTGMILTGSLISCTRATKESKSNISFSIPQSVGSKKVGAQAFDTLIHVSINITGGGIQAPIVLNWDNEKNGPAGSNTIQTSFSLDVPQGPDRLIQVLAVYGDSSNSGGGAMQFYYGDLTKTLAAPVEDAAVTVAPVGQGTTIISGRIQGRYLTSAGEGPTGRVDIVYAPPGGKAPMVVDRSMIMNGWFQFFGLLGAQLGYRMQDGNFLWGGPVDLSETSFPTSSRVMRAVVPIHLKTENYSGTVTTRQEDPSISIYGFFGDANLLSSKYVCKSVSALTNLLKVGTSTALTVADDNSTDPSNLFDTTLGFVNLRGGVALGGAAPCDTQANIAAHLFGSVLGFKSSLLENGGDSSAGFRLPFQLASESNNSIFTSTVVDADKVTISGTLLPGITNILDNFAVYKAVNLGTNFRYHSSFAPCEALTNMGYKIVGDTPVSGTTYTATLPLTATEASSGAMFALCPTKSGVPMGQGVWVEASYFRGGGGGGGGVAAKISFQNLTALTVNQCAQVSLYLMSSSNAPASSQSAVTVNLTATGNSSNFYAENDSTCSGNPVTSVSIPANSSWVGLRFKTSATPETNITLTPTDAASVLTSAPQAVRARSTGYATELRFVTTSQSANIGTCLPMPVRVVETNGNLISYNGSGTVTASGATLYTDATCTATGGTLSFAAGAATIYVKGTTAGWGNLQASATIDSLNFTANYGIGLVPAGQPTHLTLSAPSSNYLYINQCMPITVTTLDDAAAVAPVSAAQAVKFSSSGGGGGNNFYTDSSCVNSMVNMESGIASGQSSINIYFKPQTSGALNINAYINNNNYFSIGGSQNYSIGDLWMHVMTGGFNAAWYDNTCGTLIFELRNNYTAGSGAVIPNLSGSAAAITVNTNASITNGGLYSAADCTDAVVASKNTAITSGTSSTTVYMKSLLSSGNYLTVSPTYSGTYSPIYQNGNTLSSLSFAWCPPLDGGGACASSLSLSGPNVGGGVALYTPDVSVSTSMDKTITITNTSGSFVTLSAMAITGAQAAEYTFKGGSYPGTGGTCTGGVSPASSCTVVVTFTPTAVGGRYATLNVNYGSGVTLPLALQGNGL